MNAERDVPKKTKGTPIVVSIINLKGGVGKTTIAALLARYAAKKGLKVLAVDIDPQSNLSQALMTENEYKEFMANGESSIVELLNDYRPPSHQQSAPTSIDVNQVVKQVGYNEDFHLIPSRFDFSDNLIESVKPDARALARFISKKIVIDVCGVLINNSESTESPRGPHHRNAWDDIQEQARKYNWPIMENEMFLSRGYPKLMRELYPGHTGNAQPEFRRISDEFLTMMRLL